MDRLPELITSIAALIASAAALIKVLKPRKKRRK